MSRPSLDRELVSSQGGEGGGIVYPTAAMLALPERAVQFGTGAFLRGFIEPILDDANRAGRFEGRVVAIGSTGSGRDEILNGQDGLYTLCSEGIERGAARQELRVVGSLSRALSARDEWEEVLACARNPELRIVFSNTTEVGITLDETDRADASPPASFPGKLARFLFERARAFGFDPAFGLVVAPCELIDENGKRLREIVGALARRWELDARFERWLDAAVPFCNTLVDRIVPGAPTGEQSDELRRALPYTDDLLLASELYRLFAIEGDAALAERLGFASASGVVVTPDVGPYRTRKVRLLNGTHTASVPLALLCGCELVREAMEDELLGRFIRRALFDEIVPSVDAPDAEPFARDVVDRFENPYIRHALSDITLHGTMKMRVRVIPSIVELGQRTGRVAQSLAFGFAAHVLFMRGDLQQARRDTGHAMPLDDQSSVFAGYWGGVSGTDDSELVSLMHRVYADHSLWGIDLSTVPGFVAAATEALVRLVVDGPRAALAAHLEGAGV